MLLLLITSQAIVVYAVVQVISIHDFFLLFNEYTRPLPWATSSCLATTIDQIRHTMGLFPICNYNSIKSGTPWACSRHYTFLFCFKGTILKVFGGDEP